MRCLYTSRNNSFNHPIFQSKLLELLSRNYKNKKKITMESLSFRQKLSTSKISHTNSYINSNTNTNTNSIIKQSGNNTKRKNSKTKININSKHKFSMSNDNFNEYNKKIRNFDVINTIYTTKTNSKNKNTHINTNNNKKRSKSKNNNFIKNEKTSKSKNKKKINTSNKIMINLDNDLSLKNENQRLKMQLLELQNEYDKLKMENDLLVSQNRNQKTCLSNQEKVEISNKKKTKKINKLNNHLNLEINNIDNNYPCDYFNINNSNNNFNNYKNKSPIHDYVSSKNIFHKFKEKNILSRKASKDNIKIENYFTIGNNDKINNNNINQSKLLNTSKNKILLSMYNIKNIKNKLNKSNSRLMTQVDKNNTNSTILNTEKFLTNLKKNKIKEKLRPQELIYIPNNTNNNINEENSIRKGIFTDKIKNIALKKGKSKNLFELKIKNITLNSKNNNQNKNPLNLKGNIKNIIIKKVESKKSTSKCLNCNNNENEFKDLQEKMENIYQRAKNLLSNYDTFIESNIKLNK